MMAEQTNGTKVTQQNDDLHTEMQALRDWIKATFKERDTRLLEQVSLLLETYMPRSEIDSAIRKSKKETEAMVTQQIADSNAAWQRHIKKAIDPITTHFTQMDHNIEQLHTSVNGWKEVFDAVRTNGEDLRRLIDVRNKDTEEHTRQLKQLDKRIDEAERYVGDTNLRMETVSNRVFGNEDAGIVGLTVQIADTSKGVTELLEWKEKLNKYIDNTAQLLTKVRGFFAGRNGAVRAGAAIVLAPEIINALISGELIAFFSSLFAVLQ